MSFPRSSGVLLHVTSLPGSPLIGDLGQNSIDWLNFLSVAGQRYWQILPLGPTGYGDSPYQSYSAFAGNPMMISAQSLVEDGLLHPDEANPESGGDPEKVDFHAVSRWKQSFLATAFDRFMSGHHPELASEFDTFKKREKYWLDDYILFRAIKESCQQRPWWEWRAELKLRNVVALDEARDRLRREIEYFAFKQWIFDRQWKRVRRHAHSLGIQIIGDLPIFVAHDSADAWANPELFYFDHDGNPTVVAGVPPDYFSPTGQLWGNPIYRWDRMAENGFSWWIDRFRALFSIVDIARVDHFRGFDAYWAVPFGRETAEEGSWRPGPGIALFEAVNKALGHLPIIAEDLGFITPGVIKLRDDLGLPGMHILQFAFSQKHDNPEHLRHPFLPHFFGRNSVCYTGTHDNDTTIGWMDHRATPEEREVIASYLGIPRESVAWQFIRTAWSSVADTAIAPLQDLLDLGNDARMNLPGTLGGNWEWRCGPGKLTGELAERLRRLTEVSGRMHPDVLEAAHNQEVVLANQ